MIYALRAYYIMKIDSIFLLPRGQDLQSELRVPGASSNATKEPFGHFLQLVLTNPTSSE